jgi:hypothetical protein
MITIVLSAVWVLGSLTLLIAGLWTLTAED